MLCRAPRYIVSINIFVYHYHEILLPIDFGMLTWNYWSIYVQENFSQWHEIYIQKESKSLIFPAIIISIYLAIVSYKYNILFLKLEKGIYSTCNCIKSTSRMLLQNDKFDHFVLKIYLCVWPKLEYLIYLLLPF